jgi:predicted pyridoxine 5'-phosphate oxidase superfamily flavin-nucleotide-binding protein
MDVAYLTTSTIDGRVNILACPFTDVVDDTLVLIPDLFAQKTKVNLNENHDAALSLATADGQPAATLRGSADVIQWGHPRSVRIMGLKAGDVLDRWGDWDEDVESVLAADELAARPTVFAQRGVIVFEADSVGWEAS